MGTTVLNQRATAKLPAPSQAELDGPARKEILDRAIGVKIGEGGHLEHRIGDYEAVVKTGSKPNHVLHLILTILNARAMGDRLADPRLWKPRENVEPLGR
jgi:hypothetical protein